MVSVFLQIAEILAHAPHCACGYIDSARVDLVLSFIASEEIKSHLVKNCERDKSNVAVSHSLPAKSIQETNLIVHCGCSTHLSAVRARTRRNISVVAKDTVAGNSSLTGSCCTLKSIRVAYFCCQVKSDNRQGCILSIYTQEVQKGNRG